MFAQHNPIQTATAGAYHARLFGNHAIQNNPALLGKFGEKIVLGSVETDSLIIEVPDSLNTQENDSNIVKNITIEVNEENNHIIINIFDSGIGFGIFAANIKDILNPYFTTKKNGTGLGLSIVSKIINDHNGSIIFKNINDGAQIEILLPNNNVN